MQYPTNNFKALKRQFTGTTRVSWYQKGKARKVKPI